jgi:hypothetical protein
MTEDLWGACAGCRDLRPVEGGWPAGQTLILLYPATTQIDGTDRYRTHAELLAAAGHAPVATSWGEEPPGVGSALFFGNLEEAYRVGTLLVTYRRETRA